MEYLFAGLFALGLIVLVGKSAPATMRQSRPIVPGDEANRILRSQLAALGYPSSTESTLPALARFLQDHPADLGLTDSDRALLVDDEYGRRFP